MDNNKEAVQYDIILQLSTHRLLQATSYFVVCIDSLPFLFLCLVRESKLKSKHTVEGKVIIWCNEENAK